MGTPLRRGAVALHDGMGEQDPGSDHRRRTVAPVGREVTNVHPMVYGIADYE